MKPKLSDIVVYITFSFILGACAFGLIGQCEPKPMLNTKGFEHAK